MIFLNKLPAAVTMPAFDNNGEPKKGRDVVIKIRDVESVHTSQIERADITLTTAVNRENSVRSVSRRSSARNRNSVAIELIG